jgi:ubiquinone/menaquinone biosynthesis C-methylase UbiE
MVKAVADSIAETYGRRWGAGAAVRAEHYAQMTRPAWEAVADAVGLGPGTRLLDVGCGSGEFGAHAAGRGAVVHGIDAAAPMIALAGAAVPGADLRVGTLERLPWPDGAFDVVTGFNSFQFAPDMAAALAEAARVVRPGGRLAVCNWGRPDRNELFPVTRRVQELHPEPTLVPRRPVGEPGVLEGMLRDAGLTPTASGDVAVPYAPPDQETLLRGLLAGGNIVPVTEYAGEDVVRATILEGAAPFRLPDGSYLFRNEFRWAIATKHDPRRHP